MDIQNAKRQIIVGHANTFHDPAIAVLEGDKVFAEGTERHTQCKNGMDLIRLHYSWRAVRDALKMLDIAPVKNADVTVLGCWDSKRLDQAREAMGMPDEVLLEQLPDFAVLERDIALEPIFVNHLDCIFRGLPTDYSSPDPNEFPNTFALDNVAWHAKEVPHHLTHAALAVYSSSFEECVVLVLDGWGETSGPSFFHFKDNQFQRLNEDVLSNYSIGFIYDCVTQLCGFDYMQGEQWKIMGLAAYGKYRPELYDFFMRHVKVDGLNVHIDFSLEEFTKELGVLTGGFRRYGDDNVLHAADLAHNAQKWFEDVVIELVQAADRLNLSKNLAYSGGNALNSSANGKLLKNSGFEQLHVPCAPADDGNALGAALYEKYCVQGQARQPKVMLPYLGSDVNKKRLEHILSFKATEYRYIEDEAELCAEVADLLADGKIIGWMQGRAEFGPRALGNRSILADPGPSHMKEKINNLVKFREEYRPLAPSVLHEFGPDYFEDYQESPYMERTLPFRKEVQHLVPGAVHLDGTGRLQTVKQEWNPRYYRLLHSFYQKTDIPMLINTSFNVMGKPIIHGVEDAITVFYTTGLEYLIIDNYILYK